MSPITLVFRLTCLLVAAAMILFGFKALREKDYSGACWHWACAAGAMSALHIRDPERSISVRNIMKERWESTMTGVIFDFLFFVFAILAILFYFA